MSWFSLIVALVKIISRITTWATNRGVISSAQKALLADLLLAEAENVDRALKARLAQRLRDAGGVFDEPDKFRRD